MIKVARAELVAIDPDLKDKLTEFKWKWSVELRRDVALKYIFDSLVREFLEDKDLQERVKERLKKGL